LNDFVKVLATASDPHVGGSNFDRLIADHFCEEFKGRYRINVHSAPKVYLRLLQETERLKKLMSANSQEIPLSIECFMDDKDVAGKMGRKTLEQLAEPLLGRIEELMRSLLQSASRDTLVFTHLVSIVTLFFQIPLFERKSSNHGI